MGGPKLPHYPENNRPTQYLRMHEVDEVLGAVRDDRCLVILRILRSTGARVSEVLEGEYRGHGELWVAQTKNGDPRVIPVAPELGESLESLGKRRPSRSVVFKAWKKAARETGHGWARLHDVRHCVASELARAGVSSLTIARLLGHRSLTTTARYCHFDTQGLREALACVV